MSVNATMTVSTSPSSICTRSCSTLSRCGCRLVIDSYLSSWAGSHEPPEQGCGVVAVTLHDAARLVGVPGEDGLRDRRVLLARVVDVAVEHRDRAEHLVQPDLYVRHSVDQQRRLGQRRDREVELGVGLPVHG